MTEPLHVMHVTLSLDMGGLEQVILHLVREGRKLGQRVSVLCLEKTGRLAAEAQSLGAEVHCVDKQPGYTPKLVSTIQQLLHAQSPDVLHTHQIGVLLYAGAAARRAGVPVVVHTEHGKHYDSSMRHRWLAWWAARNAKAFYCVSNDILNAVKKYKIAPEPKWAVIDNGIDTTKTANPSQIQQLRDSLKILHYAPVIGTVGRLAEIKAQDVLLKAFARLPASENSPHLLVVGGGPLESDLRQLARTLGIDARTHFVGFQPDPTPYLAMMTVFALTSKSEGHPLSVLEAWAQSLPVVASRVGGLPDLISEGETGILFDSGNDAELAACLLRLLHDDAKREQLGRNGKACVQSRFEVTRMAANYHQRYLNLRSEKSGQRPRAKLTLTTIESKA